MIESHGIDGQEEFSPSSARAGNATRCCGFERPFAVATTTETHRNCWERTYLV